MTLRALVCAAAFAMAALASPAGADSLRPHLAEELEAGPAARLGLAAHGFNAVQIDAWLTNVYAERDFSPLWFEDDDDEELGGRAREVLALIDEAETHGIAARTYYRPLLDNLTRRDDEASRAQLDILLTLALGRLTSDARQGQIAPHEIDTDYPEGAALERADLGALAREALAAPDLTAFVRAQYPQHVHYARLREALTRMRELAASGGWPTVTGGPTLKPGQTDPRVVELRARLGRSSRRLRPGFPPSSTTNRSSAW